MGFDWIPSNQYDRKDTILQIHWMPVICMHWGGSYRLVSVVSNLQSVLIWIFFVSKNYKVQTCTSYTNLRLIWNLKILGILRIQENFRSTAFLGKLYFVCIASALLEKQRHGDLQPSEIRLDTGCINAKC